MADDADTLAALLRRGDAAWGLLHDPSLDVPAGPPIPASLPGVSLTGPRSLAHKERPYDEFAETVGAPLDPLSQGAGAADLLHGAYGDIAQGDWKGLSEKSPMLAAALLGMRAPVRVANPIKAYHGSPHDFDAFDLSKIGTGEGAQAYGHGLYFAESEPVARSYRNQLSKTNVLVDDKPVTSGSIGNKWLEDELGSGYFTGMDQLDKVYAPYSLSPVVQDAMKRLRELDAAGRLKFDTSGRMYEVNLHATPEQFLDWDKPISGQSEGVQAELRKQIPDWDKFSDKTGGDYLNYGLARNTGALQEAGIPGIRYLDQGSRGKGEGTSNYVVWSPEIIEILKKYGILGPVAGATLSSVLSGSDQDKQQ